MFNIGRKLSTTTKLQRKVFFTCASCGNEKEDRNYYVSYDPVHKTGRIPYCKECLGIMIRTKEGYIEYKRLKDALKLINKPYLDDVWEKSANESNKDSFGIYIKNLAMRQYRYLRWDDSVFKAEENFKNEMSKKPSSFVVVSDDMVDFFGDGFLEEEYIAMNRKYNFLKNNYPEKTNMHIEALKTYVKYKVKEEFAIAKGDVGSASKWAELSNKAGQNAKINPSQLSASDLQGGLNSFSELIQALEESVDIIPILPTFKFRPNDAIDFNIWCYINYARHLQGLPLCDYKDVYEFYDRRKEDYIKQYGDPYGIFTNDTTLQNRDSINKFITDINDGVSLGGDSNE